MAGAAAGVASRMVTAPIDLLKIRFQLETATHPEAKTYHTILQSIRSIHLSEGISVLSIIFCNTVIVIRLFGRGILQVSVFTAVSVRYSFGLLTRSATFFPSDLLVVSLL